MQGTTDALLALANATRANKAWHGAWSALRQRHLDAASALDPGDVHGLCAEIEAELEGLHRTLVALAAGDPDAESAAPGLPGLVEVLSSHLLHAGLGSDAAGWPRLVAPPGLVVHPPALCVGVARHV